MAFTKSAQIPFSGWLPKAIRAPTPTRALVHSSTLVTAGLVLIIVYRELIFNSFTMLLILIAGFLTITYGSVFALVENSVKRTVAYSTLSQMGLSIIVVGLGSHYVGLVSLISHGLAKSLLFIQVGYLIHRGVNQQGVRG
jgi:NADH-ubiquinone oxidoreductase chain 5